MDVQAGRILMRGRDGGLPSFLAAFSITSLPDIARLEGEKSSPAALWGGLFKKKKIKSLEWV